MRKNLSKKLCRLALLCLALPLLLSLSPAERASRLDGRVSMTARILEISDRILVEVISSPYTSGEHIVHTPPETRILDRDGLSIEREALKVGDTVRIRYSGQVMLSLPPQIVAAEIRVLCDN